MFCGVASDPLSLLPPTLKKLFKLSGSHTNGKWEGTCWCVKKDKILDFKIFIIK